MTTVAWDGKLVACDTLRTDGWGLKQYEPCKVIKGKDFLLGGAGDWPQILKYQRRVASMTAAEILELGYPDYKEKENDPSLLLVVEGGAYHHGGGVWMRIGRPFYAIGSGRDYAIMAMALGYDAKRAVELTSEFDNDTKTPALQWDLTNDDAR